MLISALAGIDQALWDIKGKYCNASVSDLLGGALRQKMRACTWLGDVRPDNIGEQVAAAKANGFTAFKMNGTAENEYIESSKTIDVQTTLSSKLLLIGERKAANAGLCKLKPIKAGCC